MIFNFYKKKKNDNFIKFLSILFKAKNNLKRYTEIQRQSEGTKVLY